MKKMIIVAVLGALLFSTPVQAQIPKTETDSCVNIVKVQVTCYSEQGLTCTGSDRKDGIVASNRDWLGYVIIAYKVNEDGSRGDYIGTYEIADVGYGAPLGFGQSEFYGKGSIGSVETGLTFDFRKPDAEKCNEFMQTTYTGEGSTGSEVYIQVIQGEG